MHRLEWRKTLGPPEFAFFSALANTMRKENLLQHDFAGRALWETYRAFAGLGKHRRQLKFHFLRLTLPCMCSGRTGKGQFIFHAEFLEQKLGDRYDASIMLATSA